VNWGNEEEFSALEVLAEPLPALDNDDRNRLREVLGPRTPDAGGRSRESVIDLRDGAVPPPPVDISAEDRLITLSFVLGDIDRKIDKLAHTTELLEQLGAQVRRLSERIARIEHGLATSDPRAGVQQS